MKSKKIVPFVIYLLGVLPIVYTLINVQCRDKNYIEFRHLVDQIINNWLHFTKRLLMKFHQAYTSNDRLPDQHLLHQNIYKFCPQVPALC